MKVATFWNQAFLAALHRLPPEEARAAADEATQLALVHWRGKYYDWVGTTQQFSELSLRAASAVMPKPASDVSVARTDANAQAEGSELGEPG